MSPVEKLDGVHDRNSEGSRELGHAADVAGRDDVRAGAFDVCGLAVAQRAPRCRAA